MPACMNWRYMMAFRRVRFRWLAKDGQLYLHPSYQAIWLASVSAFAVHIFHAPVWIGAIGIITLIMQYIAKRTRRRNYSLYQMLAMLGCIFGLYYEFGRLGIGVEFAVAFLLCCALVKYWEMVSSRDAFITINLNLFIVAAVFLLSQSIGTAFFGMIALILCVRALVYVTAVQMDRRYRRAWWQVCAMALPLMAVMFVFFPRIAPLWSLNIQQNSASTGVSDSMSPGDFSNLSQSSELAFRVDFDIPIPRQNQLYWRGMVYSQFDGTTWRKGLQDETVRPYIHAKHANYTIWLEPTGQRWLFALENGAPTDGDIHTTQSGTLRVRAPIQDTFRYQVGQAQIGLLPPTAQEIQLPAGNPKTRAFAQDLYQKSGQDAWQMTQNFANFVRADAEHFRYTLTPPKLGSARIDEFLFGTRAGFCEHYASSYVFTMRAVGVPARVVGGYQGGKLSADGKTWEVRQLDAHAWAEIWYQGQWVRVDPTAFVAPQRVELGMDGALDGAMFDGALGGLSYGRLRLAQTLRTYADQVGYYWQTGVVDYTQDAQSGFLQKLGIHSLLAQIGYLLGALVAISVLLSLIAHWRSGYRLHPSERILRILTKHKLPTQSWESWIIAQKTQHPMLDWDSLLTAYRTVRFANLDDNARKIALQDLRTQVHALKKRLPKSKKML